MRLSYSYALEAKALSVFYGDNKAVDEVSYGFKRNKVTAIIGPSGCVKSTLMRAMNRMHDFVPEVKIEGSLWYESEDIYDQRANPVLVRKKIGMVFQKPNPFPKSIAKNIVWGPKINRMSKNYKELIESSLKRAALWDEVKHRLEESALSLSGGQQQRLCIARSIAMDPDIILMDEPCSALDPKSTASIEELILTLREKYTILIVTHNMQQARRISDEVLFMYEGRLVESGDTEQMFENPRIGQTHDYIRGKFG
ncbi:MAG: phosphate ABC transporter ATP-binding protein [Oligoflexales bacterium]|nr:phosphate ABC transporter ATP-binding protein [Oligoflexales bacterium]